MSSHEDPHPRDLSFIAMARFKLGQINEGRSAINALRERLDDVSLRNITLDRFSGSFEIEAERVFAGTSTQLLAIWELIDTKELDRAIEMFTELPRTNGVPDSEFAFSLEGIIRYLSRLSYAQGKYRLILGARR